MAELITNFGPIEGDLPITDLDLIGNKIKEFVQANKDISFTYCLAEGILDGIVTLTRESEIDCICKVRVNMDLGYLAFSVSFFQDSGLYSLKVRAQRLMGIRFALAQNQKTQLKLKVQPVNGEVRFECSICMPSKISDLANELPPLIYEAVNRSRIKAREIKVSLQECFAVENRINPKQYIPQITVNSALQPCLNAVQISNKICWTLLQNGRRMEQISKQFEQNIKQSVIQNKKKPIPVSILTTTKINSKIPIVDKQDEKFTNQLKRKSKDSKNPKVQLLKIINEKFEVKEKRQLGLEMFEAKVQLKTGAVDLLFEKVVKLERERKILKEVKPNQRIKGLPSYYIFQNSPAYNEYRVTDLIDYDCYLDLINKSQQTISTTTKIFLLKQISQTIFFLRQKNIILQRLTPQHIRIQKGLEVKFYDLTRAFYPGIDKNRQPEKGNLYLLNALADDEREDVFSFGAVMYRTFFGIAPLYMRRVPCNIFSFNFPNYMMISTQKFTQYGPKHLAKLVGNLSLKCMSARQSQKEEGGSKQPNKQTWNFDKVVYVDGLALTMNAFDRYLSII